MNRKQIIKPSMFREKRKLEQEEIEKQKHRDKTLHSI